MCIELSVFSLSGHNIFFSKKDFDVLTNLSKPSGCYRIISSHNNDNKHPRW